MSASFKNTLIGAAAIGAGVAIGCLSPIAAATVGVVVAELPQLQYTDISKSGSLFQKSIPAVIGGAATADVIQDLLIKDFEL